MIKNREEWVSIIRDVSLLPDAPVAQKDGIWSVLQRRETWDVVGPRIFDDHLDRFRKVAVEVLRERHPEFELEPEKRFAASVYGKVLKHSHELRKGLAETMALLGSFPEALTSCSDRKAEITATLTVREILADADSILWGSLNHHLPMLAEAAPGEILDAVERATAADPSPFGAIYAQESGGVMGRNYMTGLLWALETLAWHPDYLSRVIVLLGDLAKIDPGGNWANRPANSARDILLPWHPQTCADISKRQAAVTALLHEHPEVGWQLLLALLPEGHGVTSGTRKPRWRAFIPPEYSDTVTTEKYWEQVDIYANLAVNGAISDTKKLPTLIQRLPNLTPGAISRLLEFLHADSVAQMAEPDRRPIWEALVSLVVRHRKYPDAKWAMAPTVVDEIDNTARRLAPASANLLHRRLFSARDLDLFEGKGDYEQQRRDLIERRHRAITEILSASGIEGVLAFAQDVNSPWQVGLSLGVVSDQFADAAILPAYLVTDTAPLEQLSAGFVWGRFHSKGWNWVDDIDTQNWNDVQKGTFLTRLPFCRETWLRVERLLGTSEAAYWKKTSANPYEAQVADLASGAEKLLQYGRPRAAIQCVDRLTHDTTDGPTGLVIRVLQGNLKSDEPENSFDQHATLELIGWLQKHPSTPPNELFQLEWAYLPLLDSYSGGSPKTLVHRLAQDPAFFCEVIRAVYRSKTEAEAASMRKRNIETAYGRFTALIGNVIRMVFGKREDKVSEKSPEERKSIAENAYRLLSEWRLPPGCDDQGHFDESAFKNWVDTVKQSTKASGHFEVAMNQFGQVLPYSPRDPDGLWIHKAVAEILNAKDGEQIRSGFTCELFNMRGAYWFTAGQQEREIAARYREQADDAEAGGFHRLATSLRDVALSYQHDAERDSKGA